MSKLGDIFKNKLDQRQFEFKEKYWEELEKKLDSHSSVTKPTNWKLFSGIIIALVIAGTAAWYFYPQSKDKSTENILVEKTEVTPNPAPENSIINSKKEEGVKIEKSNASENIPENNTSTEELKNETPKPTETKIKNQEQKPIVEKIKSDKIIESKKVNPVITASIIKETEKVKDIPESADNTVPEKENPVNVALENIPVKEKIIVDSSIHHQDNENKHAEIISENKTPVSEPAADSIVNVQAILETLQDTITAVAANSIPVDSFNFKKLQQSKLKIFAGLYGSVFYTGKNLKTNDAELSEYISRRENEESAIISWGFGVDAGVRYKKMIFSTGINYHEQGEKTNYKPEFYQWEKFSTSTWDTVKKSYLKYDTTNITIQIDSSYWTTKDTTITYWNSSIMQFDTAVISVPVFVVYKLAPQIITKITSTYVSDFDSIETINIDSIRKLLSGTLQKTTTKFSYVEIPLMIGYEIPFGKLKLMIRTGVGIGILSQYKTTYLKSDISGTEQITSSQINQMMYNYLLRVGILYRLNSHLSLNIEPMFRTNINNVFRENKFTQKYWNAGMNGGFIYLF